MHAEQNILMSSKERMNPIRVMERVVDRAICGGEPTWSRLENDLFWQLLPA